MTHTNVLELPPPHEVTKVHAPEKHTSSYLIHKEQITEKLTMVAPKLLLALGDEPNRYEKWDKLAKKRVILII